MKNSDQVILRKIKQVFSREIRRDHLGYFRERLARLYSDLSFEESYKLQDLFPKIPLDYEISKRELAEVENLRIFAHKKRQEEQHTSSRERFREKTGIDVGRAYVYPNNMSWQDFQKSFNKTNLHEVISDRTRGMATLALGNIYPMSVVYKLFLEKEKAGAAAMLRNSYDAFWKANPGISGYADLKNIQNFDDMKVFLTGIASEIPLDDISLYLRKDKKADMERAKNAALLKKEFGEEAVIFCVSDKTYATYVKPMIENERLPQGRSLGKGANSALKTPVKWNACDGRE